MTYIEEKIWGSEDAKSIIQSFGHYRGKPHSRVFCPRCGMFGLDDYDITYSLCGRKGCIEKNIRLVIVRFQVWGS